MSRDDVLDTLHQHRRSLDELGVARLALFGSLARGEESQASDVDLLVEFSRPVGLFHFVHVKRYLESILERPVDLVTSDALHPAMRAQILAEAVDAA